MKKIILFLLILIMCLQMAGCGNKSSLGEEPKEDSSASEKIVVGFSQLGAESDWRSSNSESMKNAFASMYGYNLIFEDGQQKQANQITAIRNFIQQGVDYIVLAPVTETGWDTVLQEAKDAGIPVIIVDRMVDVADEGLFISWVGSDFELEGRKAAEWLKEYTVAENIAAEDINIVNLQGSLGSSAQLGRTKGLEDAVKENGWNLLEEAVADFTQAKGEEVMAALLKKYHNINVVYCENDNEALGAITAIEAAGKTVGSDIKNGEIMILSFDGVNEDARNYVAEGKISCITECNPLHGPRVRAIIKALEQGDTPEKFEYVDETLFSGFNKIESITVDNKEYAVTILEKESDSEE